MAITAKKNSRTSKGKQEAIEAATKEEQVRLNVEIPISLDAALRKKVADSGRGATQKKIVIDCLTKVLRDYL